MNKAELVATVAESAGITKVAAERALNGVLANMVKAMKKGERVTLFGFGSFSVVERVPKKGRNPQTGEVITIPAHHSVRFKAGKNLYNRVQEQKPETVRFYPRETDNVDRQTPFFDSVAP
jgi:DNA-binding protein HU-beta